MTNACKPMELMTVRDARDREIARTCPRCIEAREAVTAGGWTLSNVPDHGDNFCAAQSVELCGRATFGAPRSYVQVRA